MHCSSYVRSLSSGLDHSLNDDDTSAADVDVADSRLCAQDHTWAIPRIRLASGTDGARRAGTVRAMSDSGRHRRRVRLDSLLADRGLFPSRSRAAVAVMAGEVRVGAGERRAAKPSELIDPAEPLSVSPGRAYVSRGGVKLANALDACGLDVTGRRALDVGSSTGGFTDCLLQRGAARVIAVDVGYGLLDYALRNDPRVSVLERTNARVLTPEMLSAPEMLSDSPACDDGAPDLATIDVSFISLTIVLPAVLACMADSYDVLAMVKPQFEVGRARVGKGGVVRDSGDRRDALLGVGRAVLGLGVSVLGCHSSGLPGPKGNRETFIHLAEPGRAGAAAGVEELTAMVRRVEP
jgi:23S rRNA (cytidine1920-2'-O)/16S rRNA (cytidine1409-2'-O)-methyltransferase